MLINKEKLINLIATEVHYDTEHPLESYAKLLMMIVEAEEDDGHGHWEIVYNNNVPFKAICSNCGHTIPISPYLMMKTLRECPICKIKMDEVNDGFNR